MPDTSGEIHIAIAFDQNFITPVYALLTSIFYNNREERLIVHAIHSGVDESEKEKIIKYVNQNNSEIFFYTINLNNYGHFIVPQFSYFTIATYYRLFFASLVPASVTKLIYLDTDTIVIGKLSELYNLEIGKYPLAAVPDAIEPPRHDLGITEKNNYFNAGVLLINLPEWNQQKISEKAIQFLIDYPEKIKWVDQDALNGVLINNWYKLNNRFNITFYDIPFELPKKDYKSFLKDKVVLHYTTGLHKPWSTFGENKFRHIYHYYLKRSPHSYKKKYTDFRFTKKHISWFIRIRIVEWLYDYPSLVKFIKKRKP